MHPGAVIASGIAGHFQWVVSAAAAQSGFLTNIHPGAIDGIAVHRAAIVAGQITGNFDAFAIGAVAIEGGVIQLGIVIDFDARTAIRGAVDCTAGDCAIQLHAITFGGFTVDGSIAFVG
ncbi:Uncharacterised protein [Yersinia kristensenii]|nr:Uncharacterised protein [Yersinia kristensenii]